MHYMPQGCGMALTEEAVFDQDGQFVTDSTWNYKIPSVTCIPQELHVQLLEVRVARGWGARHGASCVDVDDDHHGGRQHTIFLFKHSHRTRTTRGVSTAARLVVNPLCSCQPQ